MASGWRIGSICGIPLLLNPTWFYSLALFSFFFSADWRQPGLASWIAGLTMALLLFASVLLHELGHSLVAQSQGLAVNSITLFPFGGMASISQESKTPAQAFWVAIAGPAVSFGLFLLLVLLSIGLPETLSFKILLSRLAVINLILALFNLLPGLPLDGGQVVKAAVWQITGSHIRGVRWAARLGQGLGWLAIGLGISGFLYFSLRFSFLWLVLLGWFGLRRASALLQETRLQEAMLHLHSRDALQTNFRTVAAALPLVVFADQVSADPSGPIYYVEAAGRYVGQITPARLQAVDHSQGGNRTVQDCMLPLAELPTIAESASLAATIDQLETQALPQLLVVSAAGTVLGVVDRVTIMQALADDLHLQIPEAIVQQIQTEGQFPSNLPLHAAAKDALK
jgi:Zn-dependent protease